LTTPFETREWRTVPVTVRYFLGFSHGVTIGTYLMQLAKMSCYTHREDYSVTMVKYLNGESCVDRIADTFFGIYLPEEYDTVVMLLQLKNRWKNSG
jgi:hypothetical protein